MRVNNVGRVDLFYETKKKRWMAKKENKKEDAEGQMSGKKGKDKERKVIGGKKKDGGCWGEKSCLKEGRKKEE